MACFDMKIRSNNKTDKIRIGSYFVAFRKFIVDASVFVQPKYGVHFKSVILRSLVY